MTRHLLRTLLAALLLPSAAPAAVSIDAVYYAQTHLLKPDNPYFGLVSDREALIKAHVVDPAQSAAPAVTATLSLGGQTLDLTLTGPGTLPASVPDGLGVVQHSFTDTFTAVIPAAWVQPGLDVTINAGTASVAHNNLEIGAPTKVIMTMFDVHYFAQTSGDYPAGWNDELEAKWPVADLEIRRLPNVVFPELVIPPRAGVAAARVSSPAEYLAQTGLNFDGEQAAALAWNGALKRATGKFNDLSLYYINIYGVGAGGQAGGFSGVGNGTSAGILHHELGHALSLPHWANSSAYPYKGSMHGINPRPTNNVHAGPAWAYDPATQTPIPPTRNFEVSPGVFEDVYKVDPMQGGGTGDQEAPFLLNHFSDYSVNQMRNYLEGKVAIWNDSLSSYAKWNQAAADYTSTVSNDGVQYPIVRDTQVITVMASISGSNPDVCMVYPPIGPYTSGLIKRFDPTSASDRTEAQAIFAPANGCDVTLRIQQGGVEKTYMLAASWEPGVDPLSGGSLKTEAVNLPATDGEVTRVDLLLTPDAEINGLPADPEVLYTWSPVTPDPAGFELAPTAGGSTAITMRAVTGTSTGDPVEYLFTETTGNPGGSSSGWQSSSSYTDTGLLPETPYAYTVTMRAGAYTGRPSAEAYETTNATGTAGSITVDSTQQFNLANSGGLQPVTGLGAFDADGADKLVVVVSTEHGYNNGDGFVFEVRYNGTSLAEAVQEDAGGDRGAAAIFYLDDPGPIGAGTIEVSASGPNGGIGAAYALSGTAPDFGATATATGETVTSVNLTTSGDNALVVAVIENSGNANGAGSPAAQAPLIPVSSGFWGSQWGGHASGHQTVAVPSTITPTFSTNTGSGYSINIAAAEFLAAPVGTDTTPPTLAGSDIVDDQSGGPVMDTDTVTYTVTFSESMTPSTVNPGDFGNAGIPAATINSVTPTGNSAVFEVSVTPGGPGTLQLQVLAGASLEDLAGNALDTAAAITDDTIITVNGDTTAPTLVSITDNAGGGPILETVTVTYTVTFSEAMNASTVNPADFENGGSPFAVINSVTATGDPAVFAVEATPTGPGTLRLQIAPSASLQDPAGNPLDAGAAGPDDTIITVNEDTSPPTGDITIDSFQSALAAGGSGAKTFVTNFDATGSDKLVLVLGGEHGFSGNSGGNFDSVTFNGVALTEAAQEGSSFPTAAIFYLDNPGAAGVGDIVVTQQNHNQSMYALYLLSGTAPGIGNTATDTDETVALTTTAANSLVIVGYDNSGPGGGNGAGNVNAVAPLTEDTPYLEVGNTWNSLASGHVSVASPTAATYAWTVDDPNDVVATVAAEFLAVPAPPDYDVWAALYPSADLSDPDADADGDGLGNDYERIFGLDPSDNRAVNPISVPLNDAGMFSYTRRDDDLTGQTFKIYTSTTMQAGSWVEDTGATQLVTGTDANDVETVEVTLSALLLSHPQLFVRIGAE